MNALVLVRYQIHMERYSTAVQQTGKAYLFPNEIKKLQRFGQAVYVLKADKK